MTRNPNNGALNMQNGSLKGSKVNLNLYVRGEDADRFRALALKRGLKTIEAFKLLLDTAEEAP